MKATDERSVRRLIIERLVEFALDTLALESEDSAIGYYPLFCAVAKAGRSFGVLSRSGNVHDSGGA